MSIRTQSRIFFLGGAALLALFAVLLFLGLEGLHRAHTVQYASSLLVEELRQSSDDLTRMARSYVFTGDPGFERLYWVTLAIRNGEAPRPPRYARLDWDTAIRAAARRSRDGVRRRAGTYRGSRSAPPVCCGTWRASLGASLATQLRAGCSCRASRASRP